MSEVTRILEQIREGDPLASEQLLPILYDELRTLAAQKLAQEQPGQTLQATAPFTKPIFGWSERMSGGAGRTTATSLPLRPKRCGGS